MKNGRLVIGYLFFVLVLAGLFYVYWSLAVLPDIQGGIYFVLACAAAFCIAPFPLHYYFFPTDRAPWITQILATPLVWACFLIFIGVLLNHDLSFWTSIISFIGVVVGAVVVHACFPGTPDQLEAIAAKKAQQTEAAREDEAAAHEPQAVLIPIKIPNEALDVPDLLSEVLPQVMFETLRPATLAIGPNRTSVTVHSGAELAREVGGFPSNAISAIYDTGQKVGVGAQSMGPLLSGTAFGIGLSLALYLRTDQEAVVLNTGEMMVVFCVITMIFAFGFWLWSQLRADQSKARICAIENETGSVLHVVVSDDGLAQLEGYAMEAEIAFASRASR